MSERVPKIGLFCFVQGLIKRFLLLHEKGFVSGFSARYNIPQNTSR